MLKKNMMWVREELDQMWEALRNIAEGKPASIRKDLPHTGVVWQEVPARKTPAAECDHDWDRRAEFYPIQDYWQCLKCNQQRYTMPPAMQPARKAGVGAWDGGVFKVLKQEHCHHEHLTVTEVTEDFGGVSVTYEKGKCNDCGLIKPMEPPWLCACNHLWHMETVLIGDPGNPHLWEKKERCHYCNLVRPCQHLWVNDNPRMDDFAFMHCSKCGEKGSRWRAYRQPPCIHDWDYITPTELRCRQCGVTRPCQHVWKYDTVRLDDDSMHCKKCGSKRRP